MGKGLWRSLWLEGVSGQGEIGVWKEELEKKKTC